MPSRARVNATSDTQQLAEDLRRASSQVPSVVITSGRFTAQIGQAVRVRPGAAGVELNLPPADQASAGGSVTFFVEPAGGVATVRCPNGSVNAATSLVLRSPGLMVFESNGKGGWFSGSLGDGQVTTGMLANNAVTNAKLAQMGPFTVKGNPTGVTANAADISLAARSSTLLGTLRGGNVAALSRLELAQVMLPRVRTAQMSDLFVGGLATDGNIGQLGWRLWSGAFSKANNSTLGGSSRSLLTSPFAGLGSIGLGTTGGANGGWTAANAILLTQWRINTQVAVAPATFVAFVGWSDAPSVIASTANDSFGFFASQANANWRILTVQAGVTTNNIDTGIAYAADQQFTFTIIQSTAGVFNFYIDNTLVTSISTTFAGSFSPVFQAFTGTVGATYEISPLAWSFAPRNNVFTSETFLDTLE